MKVRFSKDFEKAVGKLTGKNLTSVLSTIREVKEASTISEIHNCKKLVSYQYIYRIRIGCYRAFFTFHLQIIDDIIEFQYLVSRGEAYNKKSQSNLRGKDK